ncbi:hypothetical protein DBIPINDM_003054 [Mesorhizobium sp. AR02]|uniref:hypothetical protein n=1 Tax=Mesorhizobium sp. AR02 TaxID=2865837 RepID=UPI00215F8D9F|nr:hypothetical protein [Mesorhizobium sp. AR02]UVK56445.1 hypothetical protein DBIPINDM_003054 [Mesorhizobium sp. AR02]
MDEKSLENALSNLSKKILFLQSAVSFLESELSRPLIVPDGDQAIAFRFSNPSIVHFCVLHLIRVVSCLNALIVLARYGYVQEICVLIRTGYEFLSKVDYVSTGYYDPEQREKVKLYVERYFSDNTRKPKRLDKDVSLRQKEINEGLQKNYENTTRSPKAPDDERGVAEMHRYVLSVFSNYVHARYPEVMDMFGGTPVQPHMVGMKGTPKDAENIVQIYTFFDSTNLSLKNVYLRLGYANSDVTPPSLREWAKSFD